MHSIETIEKGFRWAALPVALISAYFTYQFAHSTMSSPAMGFLLGVALAICALASGYIWTVRSAAIRYGVSQNIATFMLAIGIMFTGTDALTNAGSLLWQRAGASNEAKVTNIKFEDSRKAIVDAEATIKLVTDRIEQLKAANPWLTTTSADGLKGQLPAIEEAIAQESRRGGCGPICLSLKEKMAALQDQIGKAEKLSEHDKMLAAANRSLEEARKDAAGRDSVVSSTASQAMSLASLGSVVAFSPTLDPSAEAQEWVSYAVGVVLALFLTFGPMALNWVGFGAWRDTFKLAPRVASEVEATPEPVKPAPAPVARSAAPGGGGIGSEPMTINLHPGDSRFEEFARRVAALKDQMGQRPALAAS